MRAGQCKRGSALAIATAVAALLFATAAAAKPRAHGIVRTAHPTRAYGHPASRTPSSEHSVIGPDGRALGADPDPAVRFELRRDPGRQNALGSPM